MKSTPNSSSQRGLVKKGGKEEHSTFKESRGEGMGRAGASEIQDQEKRKQSRWGGRLALRE